MNIDITGNFLEIIRTLYKNTKSAVKVNDKVTDWFTTEAGVRQGQNDSPTLFLIYINSLVKKIKSMNLGVKYGKTHLSILVYADDIVLISETEESLQSMLNELHIWCSQWNMFVNMDKTLIMHFRRNRKPRTVYQFQIGNMPLLITDVYRYLGVHLDEHLNYKTIGNKLSEAAARATGKLAGKFYSNRGLGFKTYSVLYESCICPIMDYCSGVWGYVQNEKLDRIHSRIMQCFLGVNRYAPKPGIEGEMAWVPPFIRRKLDMLRLWHRLVSMEEHRLPKIIFQEMRLQNEPWILEIKEIFYAINCETIFHNNCHVVNFKQFLRHAKLTMQSHQAVSWNTSLELKPKLELYRNIKQTLELEEYCKLNLKGSQRCIIAKLRLGILPINIELGRYNNTPREDRLCTVCDKQEVEDEKHLLFSCPVYANERRILLTSASHHIPNFNLLNKDDKIKLLTTHINLVRKTSSFVLKALQLRNEELRILA